MKAIEVLTPRELTFFEIDKDRELYSFFYEEDKEKIILTDEEDVYEIDKEKRLVSSVNNLKEHYLKRFLEMLEQQGFLHYALVFKPITSNILLSICVKLDDEQFFIVQILREENQVVKKNYSSIGLPNVRIYPITCN